MAKNIEIKARVPAPEETRRIAASLASDPPLVLEQTDTFLQVPRGRLKVRAFADGSGELIAYHRPNRLGPSESVFIRSPCANADTLLDALRAVLPILGTVRKKREVFFVGRTRVHLDQVEDLGWFMELEVVLAAEESVEDGTKEAEGLMDALEISDKMLVAEAYIDLLDPPETSA